MKIYEVKFECWTVCALEHSVVVGVFDTREAAEQACAEFEELRALLEKKWWLDSVYLEINEIPLGKRMTRGEMLAELHLCHEDDEELFMQFLQDPNQEYVWGGIVEDWRREEKEVVK